MCWSDEGELYNDGAAFKITARDERGVIVTILADNYYGYCKKEVKTQISYAANLFGLAEEEHAGGALAFPRHNHGEEFGVDSVTRVAGYSFEEMVAHYGELMDLQPRRLRHRQAHPGSDLRAAGPAHGPAATRPSAGSRTARASRSSCSPARSTSSPTATRSRCRSTPARLPGAWSAPIRKALSATSPAPSPAAASRKFPSR